MSYFIGWVVIGIITAIILRVWMEAIDSGDECDREMMAMLGLLLGPLAFTITIMYIIYYLSYKKIIVILEEKIK